MDAVRRSHVVLGPEVSEGAPKVALKPAVLIGYGNTGRAALPYSHQPDSIEAECCHAVPFRGWDSAKVDCLPCSLTQLREPYPSIDLIQRRVMRPCRHEKAPKRNGC